MSSATKCAVLFVLCTACTVCAALPLRVCADPNNLPYSNDQQQGFENKLANLIGADLGMEVTYFWFPQRETFFKKTLNSGVCDVVMGVPVGFDEAATTRPYYRSTYVFVTRRDHHLQITSLDDPRLRSLKIGVHVLGEQDDSLPPVHALVSRKIVRNLVGFSIFGNLNEKDPPADLMRAVESGKVDIAVAWGPLAGYFTRHASVPLQLTPIPADPLHPDLPFRFDIGIGVRESDGAFKQTLDRELMRRRPEIEQILRDYGIPQLDVATETARSMED
jgi:quinoprotein dehydrogenase-associated probable ABC transporter substrate-binding protein